METRGLRVYARTCLYESLLTCGFKAPTTRTCAFKVSGHNLGAKSTLHSLLHNLSSTAITTLHAFLYCT
jgi:hypothetical protein